MPVNPELRGRVFDQSPRYLVGREKIREFSAAVFSTSPVNFDVEAAQAAGYPDLVAPPTFGVILQQFALDEMLADPDAAIDFARVVHGTQRFVSARPILAGDELSTALTVTDIKTLAGNAMITAEARITDAAGDHVATATSTLVVRAD